MDVVDYCRSLEIELSNWRQKLEDLRRMIEALEDRQREAMLSSVHDLAAFVDRMAARIDALKADCPTGAFDDRPAPARATNAAVKTAP